MTWLDGLYNLIGTHQVPILAALALSVGWCAAEYYARSSTWKQGAPKKPTSAMDRGTYPVIAIAVTGGLLVDLFGFLSGIGGYLPVWTVAIGVLVCVLGLSIRVWALVTLGRFFTMPITIAPDHQIVRGGPYRWLRHPAYTGGFLTAVGVPIALGTSLGVVVALLACAAAYVYRIRIEEAALLERFGDAYREYSSTTSRLLPGVY